MHHEINRLIPYRPVGPQRIVCLSPETVEWLYMLGQQERIAAVCADALRPSQARVEKMRLRIGRDPQLIEHILSVQPDLVLGFSERMAETAAELVRRGVPVMICSQRSVAEIFETLQQLAGLLNVHFRAETVLQQLKNHLLHIANHANEYTAEGFPVPRVYFEEFGDPPVSGVRWVSELIRIAGGQDIFPDLAVKPDQGDRLVDMRQLRRRAPDIIIGAWRGFSVDRVMTRPGWDALPAVRDRQVFGVAFAEILAPGPAALTDGAAHLADIISDWRHEHSPIEETSSQMAVQEAAATGSALTQHPET